MQPNQVQGASQVSVPIFYQAPSRGDGDAPAGHGLSAPGSGEFDLRAICDHPSYSYMEYQI
jgi:hypothetical protein